MIQDQDNNLKSSETPKVELEQPEALTEKTPEKKPESLSNKREEEIIADELRRQIELMELDPAKAQEVEKEKERIEFLGEPEKIEHLLKIARDQGLVVAVHSAKKTNDPFLLDLLHDTLIREGLYEKFKP